MKVKIVAKLTPETGIPVKEMKDQLSVFQTAGGALAWTGHFRGSPTRWKAADGEAVAKAVLAAAASPIIRPIDPAKLKYRSKALKAKIGLVTVPESEPVEDTHCLEILGGNLSFEIKQFSAASVPPAFDRPILVVVVALLEMALLRSLHRRSWHESSAQADASTVRIPASSSSFCQSSHSRGSPS